MSFSLKPSNVFYITLGVSVMATVGALINAGGGIFGILAAVIAGLCSVLTLLLYRYSYFLVPMVTKFSNIIVVSEDGYELPPGQEVILKKVGDSYYATKFLAVRIYESASEKSLDENIIYSEYFERAISSVNFVAKFSMMVYVKDMGDYKMKIETRKAEAQLKLSRERDKSDPDVLNLDRFEREVAMWESEIEKMAKGFKPMAAVSYIMTTADGVSKESAIAAVKSQANELRATVSNALNAEVDELSGDEMLRCFEWEYMIPNSAEKLGEQVG